MSKKKLNKKIAIIGSAVFALVLLLGTLVILYFSRNPQKFIRDGDAAIEAAGRATDPEQRQQCYATAERNFRKAYGLAKTDELKVETLRRLVNVFITSDKWREVIWCWTQIVRLDPKDFEVRYDRLKYFYIVAKASQGSIWQDVASQTSEFIDLIEKPGGASELATADTQKWEINQLKEKGETAHRLVPYLHLIRGRANFEVARLGMVTNKDETIKLAFTDLEKVKQLEPDNVDVYQYLAEATTLKRNLEATRGNLDAKQKGQDEAISLLKEGVEVTKNSVRANINLLNMKHLFIQAKEESDLRKEILAMEPEYIALGNKFSSNAEVCLAIALFYSDFRLGPAYLDKALESIEKAINIDANNVDYAIVAANLYTRRFNIHKQKEDFNRTIEMTKRALSLPDAQETTGPHLAVSRSYQIRLNGLLAISYISRILDLTEPTGEPEEQQWLADAQQAVRKIEQIFGSGDDPQVIKWQGMVEIVSAKLQKGDIGPAVRKLYKTYTQLKASGRLDPYLSYTLAKVFANSTELGATSDFLTEALQGGIEAMYPEARLNYAELFTRVMMWKSALASIDIFEQSSGVTEKSRILRINAYIGAREFEDAQRTLEQIPQGDPNRLVLNASILQGKSRQIRNSIERRREMQRTTAAIQKALIPAKPEGEVEQRSDEQLAAEVKSYLLLFIEGMDKLLEKDPNLLDVDAAMSLCDDAIATGQLEQANLIVGKYLKYKPDNTVMLFYKRLLAEPEPTKVSDERRKQIREETISEIADPVRRALSIGIFYQVAGEPNKAEEQFQKLAGISPESSGLQVDDATRRRAAGLLFEIALEKKDWEVVDKIVQMAKKENLDDCSGDFFVAREALVKKQYESALASIESALAQRPVFGYAYMMRARINAALGNEGAALNDIQTAASTNPMDKLISRELAKQLYLRNQKLGKNATSAQIAETRSALDRTISLNPGDIEMYSFYAEYISESEPSRALAMRQALQQNAPSMQNALLLGRLATRMALDTTDTQRHQALLDIASSALEQAKKYDPQNPLVLESIADYYRLTGQQAKAEKLLTTTKDPRLLWRYYLRGGQYEEARKTLEELYKTNPKDANTIKGLLYVAEMARDKDALTKYAEQLLAAEEIADNHLLLVQTYLDSGLVNEAEKKLASFREKYPQDGRGLLMGAWLSMKQGRMKEALELVNKRLEGDQSDATAWRLRGQINYILTEYDQAIMNLNRSKALADNGTTRVFLARTYLRLGRTEDAITELKSSVEDPQAPDEARNLLEQIYLRAGRKEALKDFYAKILDNLPDSIYWLKRAGANAGNEGDLATAENLYQNAMDKCKQLGIEDAGGLNGYMRAILATGKYDKLFDVGSKYIDGNLAIVAYSRMAEGKIKIGDRATAVQYCKKAIDKANGEDELANLIQRNYALLGEQDTEQMCRQKLDSEPESFNANWMMYNLYRIKGDYNKAIQYLDAGAKAAGTNPERQLNCSLQKTDTFILAFNKTSDKNYLNEALEIYESVLAKMPNNSYILNNVAYILAENDKNLDKAADYAKRACEIKPDDPGYLDTYALVLYKNGKYPDGIQVARAAIQQYEAQRLPTPAEAYVHLAQCQEQIGELQQAREAYEQALDAGGENMSGPLKAQINASIERIKAGKSSK